MCIRLLYAQVYCMHTFNNHRAQGRKKEYLHVPREDSYEEGQPFMIGKCQVGSGPEVWLFPGQAAEILRVVSLIPIWQSQIKLLSNIRDHQFPLLEALMSFHPDQPIFAIILLFVHMLLFKRTQTCTHTNTLTNPYICTYTCTLVPTQIYIPHTHRDSHIQIYAHMHSLTP